MIVSRCECPPADQLIRPVQKQALAWNLVSRSELARPALGGDGDRLERALGTLLADHAHLVSALLQLARQLIRHELDAPVPDWRHREPRADDHRYAAALHTLNTSASRLSH